MYAWIWRKLPFGLYGKLAGSFALAAMIGSLLWFFVFPWAEPFVTPFGDVQVDDPGAGTNQGPGGGAPASPSFNPDDYEVPYETTEPGNSPSPTPSKKRR